jgi:hypothetical protein
MMISPLPSFAAMKTPLIVSLSLLLLSVGAFAQSQTLYFEHKTAEEETLVTLNVDEGNVHGTQFTGVNQTDDVAGGEITGNVREDGLLHVTFNYVVEGYRESEEQLLKLDGDKLFIGEGELEERGPGQMVLKDRGKVKFTRALKKVPLSEPAYDTPEAKAITGLLEGPMAKQAGVPVTFEGIVRISGDWAFYQGPVTVAEGKQPKDEEMAKKLNERQFQAFLKKDAKGGWKVLRSAFANEDGYFDYEGEFESPPWQLTAGLEEH